MRLICCFPLVLVAAVSLGQVWEKPVAPGLTYRMEVDKDVPRVVHALRFSLGSPSLKLSSELGGGTVFADDSVKGRETVTEMVTRTGALAGINGDFFPFTGDPLGVMVKDGQLLSIPGIQRAVFGWGDKGASQGMVDFRGTVSFGDTSVAIDGLNEECPQNKLTLNTEVAAFAVAKNPCLHAVIRMDSSDWGPNGTSTGTFQAVFTDVPRLPIQPGNAIITACGTKASLLQNLVPGQKITIKFETKGFDWASVRDTIGGGPFLVRDRAVSIDAEREHFDAGFSAKRHPRTAVGKTADGDIWLVVVDGRQKMSEGATLEEMAKIMLRLGCVDAINLDGGGSSALNIFGLTLNRPSDGGKERPVANGMLVYGPKPDVSTATLKMRLPGKMVVGTASTLSVVDSEGNPVPNSEVLWASQGDAWIDQGGLLRPMQRGKCDVTAWVRGQLLKASLDIVELPVKAPESLKKGSGSRQSVRKP